MARQATAKKAEKRGYMVGFHDECGWAFAQDMTQPTAGWVGYTFTLSDARRVFSVMEVPKGKRARIYRLTPVKPGAGKKGGRK